MRIAPIGFPKIRDEHKDTQVKEGIFITFEGGEGVGKSTHIRFLARVLEERGYEVLCLREPGGTKVGESLRAVVLDPENDALVDEAELLIYEAARAQIMGQVIQPALERGAVVLCDRFADSTIAYQVYGRGLDRAFVDEANAFATRGIFPDRTLVLCCGGVNEGLKRATQGGADRLELQGESFHARVNAAFLAIAEEDPVRVRVVDSSGDRSMTAAVIFHELSDLFPWMRDFEVFNEEFFAELDDYRLARNESKRHG